MHTAHVHDYNVWRQIVSVKTKYNYWQSVHGLFWYRHLRPKQRPSNARRPHVVNDERFPRTVCNLLRNELDELIVMHNNEREVWDTRRPISVHLRDLPVTLISFFRFPPSLIRFSSIIEQRNSGVINARYLSVYFVYHDSRSFNS